MFLGIVTAVLALYYLFMFLTSIPEIVGVRGGLQVGIMFVLLIALLINYSIGVFNVAL